MLSVHCDPTATRTSGAVSSEEGGGGRGGGEYVCVEAGKSLDDGNVSVGAYGVFVCAAGYSGVCMCVCVCVNE
jgi:hypothetical protein